MGVCVFILGGGQGSLLLACGDLGLQLKSYEFTTAVPTFPKLFLSFLTCLKHMGSSPVHILKKFKAAPRTHQVKLHSHSRATLIFAEQYVGVSNMLAPVATTRVLFANMEIGGREVSARIGLASQRLRSWVPQETSERLAPDLAEVRPEGRNGDLLV